MTNLQYYEHINSTPQHVQVIFYPPGPRRQKGVGGQHHTPAASLPRNGAGTRCSGSWVDPEMSRHHHCSDAMKEGTRYCRGTTPLILNVRNRQEQSASRRRRFTPGKDPIELEAGWAPKPVWIFWEREKLLAPVGTRAPDHTVRSIIAIITTLPTV